MDFRTGYIRTRLSAMFFLQFFVWAAWWMQISTYALEGLFLTEGQAGLLWATVPLGAIISPLLTGYVADRFFATERVLCALHLIGGVCLLLAYGQTGFGGLMAFLMIATVSFMPTLALANSLTFRNISDAEQFPRIAVFGTIGWIVSGQLVGWWLGETNAAIFLLAGAAEILLGVYCLSLPHTPPKGAAIDTDVFGLKALGLLKQPAFLLFAVSAFLISIFTAFYFYGCMPMLKQQDYRAPAAFMTLGQFTEICVMFLMPWFIAQFGLRPLLVAGMAIWAIRYLLFATMSFPLVFIAILVHGFAYVFVFVGSYIYVDKKAPPNLRASAQSLIAFLMLGVGSFLGSNLSGLTAASYPAFVGSMPAVLETPAGPEERERSPLPSWDDLAKKLDTNGDGVISLAELNKIPESGFQENNRVYGKGDLIEVFQKIDDSKPIRTRGDFRSAVNKEISVTRPDWFVAQLRNWTPMWLWFALASGVVCVVFAVGSAFTADEEPARPEMPEAKPPAAEAKPQAAEPSGPGVTPPNGSPPLMAPPDGGPQPPA